MPMPQACTLATRVGRGGERRGRLDAVSAAVAYGRGGLRYDRDCSHEVWLGAGCDCYDRGGPSDCVLEGRVGGLSVWDDLPTESTLYDLGYGAKYTKVIDSVGTWVGINWWHINPMTEGLCSGWVPFDVESPSLVPRNQRQSWSVESYNPLTL